LQGRQVEPSMELGILFILICLAALLAYEIITER
jgi:hypothetical protein